MARSMRFGSKATTRPSRLTTVCGRAISSGSSGVLLISLVLWATPRSRRATLGDRCRMTGDWCRLPCPDYAPRVASTYAAAVVKAARARHTLGLVATRYCATVSIRLQDVVCARAGADSEDADVELTQCRTRVGNGKSIRAHGLMLGWMTQVMAGTHGHCPPGWNPGAVCARVRERSPQQGWLVRCR